MPPPRLVGLSAAALREHARVQDDPSMPLANWVAQAAKVHRAAVEMDRKEAAEQAFVEYFKAAGMLHIIMKHKDFAATRLENGPTYISYKGEPLSSRGRRASAHASAELAKEVIGSVDRTKELAATIDARATSPDPSSRGSFSSTARPVSGGLASRIKSLGDAGLADGVSAGGPSSRRPSNADVTPSSAPVRRPLPIPPTNPSPKLPPAEGSSPKHSFAVTANEVDTTVRSGSAPPELLPNAHRLPQPPILPSGQLAPDGSRDLEAVLRSLRSPSDFARDFPDLDSFETRMPVLPAVPKVPPSAPAQRERPPLPPPPAAFDRRTGALNNDTSLGADLDGPSPIDPPPAYPDFSSRRSSPEVSPKQAFSATFTKSPPPPPVPRASKPPIPETTRPLRDSASSVASSSRASIPSAPAAHHHSPVPSSPNSRRGSGALPPLPPGHLVLASVLVNYFRTAAELRCDTHILFLDVRPRDQFESRRLKTSDIVCLEPIVLLRSGSGGRLATGAEIEEALVLSPAKERELFKSRDEYDYVVVYDDHSMQMPNAHETEERARCLVAVFKALAGDGEYGVKRLRKPPLLLVGGLDAWVKVVGVGGIVGKGASALKSPPPSGRQPLRELGRAQDERRGSAPEPTSTDAADLKRQRREARVDDRGSGGAAIARSIADLTLSRSASNDGARPVGPNYFNRPLSGHQGYQSPHGVASPPLAMPQQSFQRHPSSHDLYASNGPVAIHNTAGSTGSGRQDLMQEPGYIGYVPPRRQVDYPTLARPEVNGSAAAAALVQPPPPVAAAPGSAGGLYNRTAYYGGTAPAAPLTTNGYHTSAAYGPRTASAGHRHQQHAGQPAKQEIYFSSSFDDGTVSTTGLKNLGNTCYMNSTLQCLSATIPLARFFKDGSYRKCLNRVNPLGTKGQLAEAVAELIRVLWSAQYTFVSPITFREAICRFAPSFRGSDQHDAQEFLTFLLDGLHEDLNLVTRKPKPVEGEAASSAREAELEALPTQVAAAREWELSKKRDDSVIVELFQGQYRSRLQCMTCGTTSTTYNTFNTLTLPIPTGRGLNKVTLDQCLNFFMREEIMEKDNAWQCPKCKAPRKATKRLTLARLPPILIVHLKRFSFKGPFSDKLETLVQYPLYGFDLTNHVPPPLPPSTANLYQVGASGGARYHASHHQQQHAPRAQVYDLYGVTNHFGSLSSGHYTAFVRSAKDWVSIGDSRTSKADEASVASARSAYVLYYRRRD